MTFNRFRLPSHILTQWTRLGLVVCVVGFSAYSCGDDKDNTDPETKDCVDRDGDGLFARSDVCPTGSDCDDKNRVKGDREICEDREDNDCDGQTDEVISPACGCDANCRTRVVGPESDNGFNVPSDSNTQLGVDEDGFVILKNDLFKLPPYIWISNTGDGSIVKINTDPNTLKPDGTFREEGRYWTGPYQSAPGGSDTQKTNDPARTSVSLDGIAFVANRSLGTVTAIASNPEDCRKDIATATDGKNANGTTTTPNGIIEVSEMLNWDTATDKSTDGCVLWTADLSTTVATTPRGCDQNRSAGRMCLRAIAAQDAYDEADGRRVTYVWVGDTAGNLWKLNAATGAIVFVTRSPVASYGFALDRAGQLWISCHSFCNFYDLDRTSYIGRVDTMRCNSEQTCQNTNTLCNSAGEGAPYDSCVKQIIRVPDTVQEDSSMVAKTHSPKMFGITADREQNVWVGSAWERERATGGLLPTVWGLYRYTHRATATSATALLDSGGKTGRWAYAQSTTNQTPPTMTSVNGVAADDLGFVYAGGMNSFVHIWSRALFPATSTAGYYKFTDAAAEVTNGGPYGMAVDTQDRVWAIHIGSDKSTTRDDHASVIEHIIKPGKKAPYSVQDVTFQLATPNANPPAHSATNLSFPYTYSDMTGVQTRLSSGRRDALRKPLRGCAGGIGLTTWKELVFRATIPQASVLRWSARTGDTDDELRNTSNPFVLLSEVAPGDPQRLDLSKSLSTLALKKLYIELQVELVVNTFENVTPALEYFEVLHDCPQ